MWRIRAEGDLARLEDGQGRGVVVWVPTTDITFHRAQFPSASRTVWRQTAAFALEEFLIGGVEEYHFALADQGDSENRVGVAVAPMALLDDWLDRLEGEGVKVDTVWPDLFAVPRAAGEHVLWHEGGRCWLRTGKAEGLAGGVDWVCGVLSALEMEGVLKVYSDSPEDLPDDLRGCAEALPAPLEELMCEPPEAGERINLLQGEYAPESAAKVWLASWKRASMVAGLFLALYMGYTAVESDRLREQTTALQKETVVLLGRAGFDQAARTNMRAQVGRYLEQLRGAEQRQSAGVWSLMLGIEPLLSSCQACVVESIDYDNEQVALVVSATGDFRQLEEGLQGLSAARYERNDLPAGDDDRVRARFRIREGGK